MLLSTALGVMLTMMVGHASCTICLRSACYTLHAFHDKNRHSASEPCDSAFCAKLVELHAAAPKPRGRADRQAKEQARADAEAEAQATAVVTAMAETQAETEADKAAPRQ